MNVIILFLTLSISIFDPFFDTVSNVIAAINKGDASEISNYFSERVELKVLDKEDFYSKDQAESILKDFFSKRKVKSFKENHSSKGKSSNQFVVGTMDTNSGKFRVSFFLKKIENKFFISQFRIESANE